jgi:hypothetical protein
MPMSERDARGPEDNDKAGFILGESVSSLVKSWSPRAKHQASPTQKVEARQAKAGDRGGGRR